MAKITVKSGQPADTHERQVGADMFHQVIAHLLKNKKSNDHITLTPDEDITLKANVPVQFKINNTDNHGDGHHSLEIETGIEP